MPRDPLLWVPRQETPHNHGWSIMTCKQILHAGRWCSSRHTTSPSRRPGHEKRSHQELQVFEPSRATQQGQSEWRPPITQMPLTLTYEKLLLVIHELTGFRWPKPIRSNPMERDRNKKCAYHKDHGHTTETCRSLHYLVENLLKAGHLK